MVDIVVVEESENESNFFINLNHKAKENGYKCCHANSVEKIEGLSDNGPVFILNIEAGTTLFEKASEFGKHSFLLFASDFSKDLDVSSLEHFDGVIDTSKKVDFYFPMIKKFTLLFKNENRTELDQMVLLATKKLERVKKIHEKLVPLRVEKNKYLEVSSKYAAGMARGGEYFDIINGEDQLIFIMSSSLSYMTNTLVMNHFDKIRDTKLDHAGIQRFMGELVDECRELELIDRDLPEMLELSLFFIDSRKLLVEGVQFGRFSTEENASKVIKMNNYPFNENFFEKATFKYQLGASDTLYIFSPGVYKNCQEFNKEIIHQNYNNSRELLNDTFFQLKKMNSFDDFIKYDATAVCIEVKNNALVQV